MSLLPASWQARRLYAFLPGVTMLAKLKGTSALPGRASADQKPQRRSLTLQQRENISGWLWTAPWWLGFLIFSLYPMLASLYYSLTDFRMIGTPHFVGAANYIRALTADPQFWPSLLRTGYYTFTMVPLTLAASLGAAMLLNSKIKLRTTFRTVFYLPSLVPSVALAVMWTFILNPRYGLLNGLLAAVGIQGPGWLFDPKWAVPGLLLMGIWGSFGGSSMLVFLATLQSVPVDLYEVAALDGASAWQRFRHVTLPMISPALQYNLTMSTIYTFQNFLYAYLTTEGGPQWATWFFGLHIYTYAFTHFQMGYASALSWYLFIIVLATIFIYFKLSGKWVFAASEDD